MSTLKHDCYYRHVWTGRRYSTCPSWFIHESPMVKAPSILATALLHFLVFTVASSQKKNLKASALSSTFIAKVFSSLRGCAPSQIVRAWKKKKKEIAGLTHSHLEVIYSFPCAWPKCLWESGEKLEQKEGKPHRQTPGEHANSTQVVEFSS